MNNCTAHAAEEAGMKMLNLENFEKAIQPPKPRIYFENGFWFMSLILCAEHYMLRRQLYSYFFAKITE